MMNALQKIRRLLPVLDMAFQAEQVRMAKIKRRMEDLKRKLREIDRPSLEHRDSIAPAIRAGADIRWQTWAQERKVLINRELARTRRDKEKARVDMTAALSKLEAARQIETRALGLARLEADRRSSQ